MHMMNVLMTSYGMSFIFLFFFFFKQKTAYEIAHGDWSSDVCSSDLFKAVYQANSKEEGIRFFF